MGSLTRPKLLFRDGCSRCRFLSLVAAISSLGIVRRVATSSPEGSELIAQRPNLRGKLVLALGNKAVAGWGWAMLIPLPIAIVAIGVFTFR